jgi:hypothetical protein
LIKLFRRILSIVRTLHQLTDDEVDSIQTQMAASAQRLAKVIFEELQKRISDENFPERKIIIRRDSMVAELPNQDPLAGATIGFFGHSFEPFGFNPPSEEVLLATSFPQYRDRARYLPLLGATL